MEAFENVNTYSSQAILKNDYHPLKDLNQDDQNVLSELCSSGSSDKRFTFTSGGVIKFFTNLYWKNPEARLNYELTFLVKCSGGLAPIYVSYFDYFWNMLFVKNQLCTKNTKNNDYEENINIIIFLCNK